MPRRRMIDPFFWDDRKVGKLTRDERSLIMGCVGHADDDGRLQADSAYIKSIIFKYDIDLDIDTVQALRDTCLAKMKTWPGNHPYRMVLYSNSDEEYIFFPNWTTTNRPSHPTKSQLPPPPIGALPIFSEASPEELTKDSGETPSQSSLGQSSLGKDSIGKVSQVPEDFTKLLSDSDGLTDFLTTTLKIYLARGQPAAMELVQHFWEQAVGQRLTDGKAFQVVFQALKTHPVDVVALSLVKAAKYRGGKYNTAKYITRILDDKSGSPREKSP